MSLGDNIQCRMHPRRLGGIFDWAGVGGSPCLTQATWSPAPES